MLTQEVSTMGRTRRAVTQEFKREAVTLVAENGHPTVPVARELGLPPNLFRRWMRRSPVIPSPPSPARDGVPQGHGTPTTDERHPTDRGAPDAATLYRGRLAGYGLTASMSRRGHGWDNAVGERFVHTLKPELVEHRRDITREEARQDIFAWLDVFDNRTRRHATRGYRSPAEFEARAMGA
jgi:transposase InsO family protein